MITSPNIESNVIDEIWLDAIGYEGYYQVSNLGRVRSIDRKLRYLRHQGKGFMNLKGQLIQQGSNMHGYSVVRLSVLGKKSSPSVHRMVVKAFINGIPDGLQVNHKNGIKSDNRLENLEICTASENTLHSFRVLGRKQNPYRLSDGLAKGSKPLNAYKNGVLIGTFGNAAIICKKLGIPRSSISNIVRVARIAPLKNTVFGYSFEFKN